MDSMNELLNYISGFYSPEMYAALNAQIHRWSISRPLAGKRILDATPVFRNTMVKYTALLAGGADLTVAVGKDIPHDPQIIRQLPRYGIRVADEKILQEKFDAVADCAGRHCRVSSRYGYAELTRSGLEYYRGVKHPVFSVDSGILKQFETTFGTGESFFRAMEQLGYRDFAGKKLLIFGGGKVGRGVAFYALKKEMQTIIVDPQKIHIQPQFRLISPDDPEINALISGAWCIVSATGKAGVLQKFSTRMMQSKAVIANMGVEDEFGNDMPVSRVLNDKHPLNFILDEPTRINYIDPTMALSNTALVKLITGELPPGLHTPPKDMEMAIINDLRAAGTLDLETDIILKDNKL